MTTRELLTEIVKRCDACLNEKNVAEAPSPGPVVVTPPVSQQEVAPKC